MPMCAEPFALGNGKEMATIAHHLTIGTQALDTIRKYNFPDEVTNSPKEELRTLASATPPKDLIARALQGSMK